MTAFFGRLCVVHFPTPYGSGRGPSGGCGRGYIILQIANQTKMIRLYSIAFSLLLAFSLGNSGNAQPKTPPATESGRFRFYEKLCEW
jgi:hypothetical protein